MPIPTVKPGAPGKAWSAAFLFAATFAAGLLASPPLRAAAYYVGPAQGDADEPWLMETLHGVVADTISESGDTVAARPETDAYYLRPELYREDGSLVVILELWSPGPGARRLLTSRRRDARRVSSLEATAKRLTRSLIEGGTGDRSGEADAAPDGGTPLRFSVNLGMGPHLLEDLEAPSSADAETYGLDVGLEWPVSERFTLTLGNDYSWCDTALGAAYLESLTLGTNYYLGLGPTALYIGAGLGYGSAGTTIGGFTSTSALTYCGNARVGVEFLRDRAVHLGLELRETIVFTDYVAGAPDGWGLDVLLHF